MSTTRTWFGGTGKFNNPRDWSPAGVPQSGDGAILTAGTVILKNEGLSGINFGLDGTVQASEPVLALKNVALDSNIRMSGLAPPGFDVLFGKLAVSGVVTSAGDITLGSGRGPGASGDLTIDLRANSTFVNTGTISLDLASLAVNAPKHGAVFVNDGSVVIGGSDPVFNVAVTGNGTFVAPPNIFEAGFAFTESVSKGITVSLNSEGDPQSVLIDEPMKFLAAITGFGSNEPNTIDLPNTKVTSESFSHNQLKLFDDHRLVGNLNIIGDFTTSQFVLRSVNGGTDITFSFAGAATTTAPTSTDNSVMHILTHS